MARAVTGQRKTINTIAAWSVGLLIFFPILWTILTSFKTEAQAIADPPLFFMFDWTLENYSTVQERSNYSKFLWNSIIIAGGSTLLGVMIAVPAAWSMAFVPSKRTKDILLWMLSTKMLPAVGVLYPIYLGFVKAGLLDTRVGLVIVMMLINLPIIVWMLYTNQSSVFCNGRAHAFAGRAFSQSEQHQLLFGDSNDWESNQNGSHSSSRRNQSMSCLGLVHGFARHPR